MCVSSGGIGIEVAGVTLRCDDVTATGSNNAVDMGHMDGDKMCDKVTATGMMAVRSTWDTRLFG